MKNLNKIVLASIIRRAKDLSDEEILSLYHSVKEKLNAQDKSQNQVLDGDSSGKEPQSGAEDVTDAESGQAGDESNQAVDDLLESLGLGEDDIGNNPDTGDDISSNQDSGAGEEVSQESTPEPQNSDTEAQSPSDESKADPSPTESVEKDAGINLEKNTEETDDAGFEELLASALSGDDTEDDRDENSVTVETTVSDMSGSGHVEESANPQPTEIEKQESQVKGKMDNDEALIEKITSKIIEDLPNPYSPENFKTATKGFQLNRKDKDLMSDGITKPKYEEPQFRPPREDRNPFGERYKKNEKNRDCDVDSDPDLKISSVETLASGKDWNKYLESIPDAKGMEYYVLSIPVGIEPPNEGESLNLKGQNVVVHAVYSPEDFDKGRGGPVGRSMRNNGIGYAVNCLPEGHKWLMK